MRIENVNESNLGQTHYSIFIYREIARRKFRGYDREEKNTAFLYEINYYILWNCSIFIFLNGIIIFCFFFHSVHLELMIIWLERPFICIKRRQSVIGVGILFCDTKIEDLAKESIQFGPI